MTGSERELRYRPVNVFTGSRDAGNPLAVVFDADELTTDQMQKLARVKTSV
jgi:predicted PhzF superfamily epimerase YddE/YHI9